VSEKAQGRICSVSFQKKLFRQQPIHQKKGVAPMKRTWISPFVAVSFFILSITGVMMLLHVKGGGIANLHEWIGVFFVIAGVLHLILNWKAFLSCFQNKQSAVAVIVVLVISSLLLFGGKSGHEGRPDFSERGGYSRGHHR